MSDAVIVIVGRTVVGAIVVGGTVVGGTVVGGTVVGGTVVGGTVVGATVVGATVVGATVVGATVVGVTVVGLTVVGATVGLLLVLLAAGVVGVVPDAEVDGCTTGPTVVPVPVVGGSTRALMIGESPVTVPDRFVEPPIAFGLPLELPLALAWAAAGDSIGSAAGRRSWPAAGDEPARRTAGLGRASAVPADERDGAQYAGADHKVPH